MRALRWLEMRVHDLEMQNTDSTFDGPFRKPLPESERFPAQGAVSDQERKQGGLPDQPAGLPVQSTPGNKVPWQNMR